MSRKHGFTRIPEVPAYLRNYDGGLVFRDGIWMRDWEAEADEDWSDADEAALEDWEEQKRERIALANEY